MLSCLFIAALRAPAGGRGKGGGVGLLAPLCVVFSCALSHSYVVSWARCGTRLYRFLIFAFLPTLLGCICQYLFKF